MDWIQDSLRERHAQVQLPPAPDSLKGRLARLDGRIGVAGRAVLNILEEGETWVVISLVGGCDFHFSPSGRALRSPSRLFREGSGDAGADGDMLVF